ncbi:hypothetical protein HYH03_017342 [Edaphochlamys debaryana]|uniref:Transcription factor CBF/NF-Y/archaeal histone domain-containing protein n=1 Tax=Edaphochlamys debaryana TaxID=47281 RepID=A0A836BQJ0_9CHLO|nr:hypothetical protein HYH03_017342 [Edaphochlamys debaryana]|eukprot:KAG2483819.1 hypothetical protein HYH03_017342 [Edaphochlamys debaryana]
MWKALSDEEKAVYQKQAAELLAAEKEAKAAAGEGGDEPGEVSEAAPRQQLPAQVPAAWVRKLVGLDKDISRCTGEAVAALSAVADVFLGAMCAKAAAVARGSKRRTVRLDDLERVVKGDRRLGAAGLGAVMAAVGAEAAREEAAKAEAKAEAKEAGEGASTGGSGGEAGAGGDAPPGKKPRLDKAKAGAGTKAGDKAAAEGARGKGAKGTEAGKGPKTISIQKAFGLA